MVSTPERAANAEYSFSDVVQISVCAQIAGATAMMFVLATPVYINGTNSFPLKHCEQIFRQQFCLY